jgi:tetrahydromethanopterin S-methyltransferase subunit B
MSETWRKPPHCKVCDETRPVNFYKSHRTKCKNCVREASCERYRELKAGLHQAPEEAPHHRPRAYLGGINDDNRSETERSSRVADFERDRDELSGEIDELSQRLTIMDETLEETMKDIGKMMAEKDKKIQQLEARVKSLEGLEERVKALENKKTKLLDKTTPFDDEWDAFKSRNGGKIYTSGALDGTLFQDVWRVSCMALNDLGKLGLLGGDWNNDLYIRLLDMEQRKYEEKTQGATQRQF